MNTFIAIATMISLSTCGGVKTGRLLGLDGGTYDALYEIDIDTGYATPLHYYELNPSGGGLAVSPDGTLYASFLDALDSLVVLDPDTGEVDILGPFGYASVAGLAFARDGTLYGVDDTTDQLITIDLLTGTGSVVGPTSVVGNQGLGFAPDGTLYLVGTPGLDAILYTVNLETGHATETGEFGHDLAYSASIESIGDALYASAYDPFNDPGRALVTVDPATGNATKIGGFCDSEKDCPYMYGLAFLPGAGDGDRDGDVDADDVAFFEACFGDLSEPGKSPYCAFLDSDKDGDLDCIDWEAFIPNWTEDTEPPTFEPCDGALPCDGDVNADHVVDPLDSGFVLARFGCLVGTGDPLCDAADANLDLVVDPLDVGYIMSRFGECP